MKKQSWKVYILWMALTEGVGLLAGLLTREGARLYGEMADKPPLSPPSVVFPLVWTLLYALMGIGAARIYLAPASRARTESLRLFFTQLVFNFLWSLIFFNLQAYGVAFLWLTVLFALLVRMTLSFREVDAPAAWLQLPYMVWVGFAGYLNFGVWMLNR